MTTQARGRKTSGFPVSTTLPTDASLSFISSGTNYQIPLANFQAALNVIGSIVQDGDVTGVPVLDKQGTINNIRNIEPGSGIAASVSINNGVTLTHKFKVGSGGVPVLTGIANASPMIGDIVAGDNITLAAVAGGVKVACTQTPVLPTNYVIVNTMADFPAAAAGVRILAADTYYYIKANVSTSDRFDVSNGNVAIKSANDAQFAQITYSGAGDMFTGLNANFTLSSISLNAPSGRLFNFTDTAGVSSLLNIKDVTVPSCNKIALISGSSFGEIRVSGFNVTEAVTDGFDFGTTTISKFTVRDSTFKISAGALFKLATAVFTDFRLAGLNANLNGVGVYLLSGSASSANIASGSLGTVHNVKTTGTGTPLSTIAVTDVRWQFTANSKIRDTRPSAVASLTLNSTSTTFSASNTPVRANGSTAWVDGGKSHFTISTDGRVTYVGEKDLSASVTITASIQSAGAAKTICAYVSINGAVVTATQCRSSAGSTPTVFSVVWQKVLATNDYVELWIENQIDTTSVLVYDAVIRVS